MKLKINGKDYEVEFWSFFKMYLASWGLLTGLALLFLVMIYG